MNWLNYHHLLYFFTVAREGTIARACELLHVTQPTVSSQLRALERAVGSRLFHRSGRNLLLTDTGRLVYRYAQEIFSIGQELQHAVKGQAVGHPLRLIVGTTPTLPKSIIYKLLEPALMLTEPVQIIYDEAPPDELLSRLAVNALDVVLADVPTSPLVKVRAFNHLLGECSASLIAVARLASQCRRRFPRALNGAPFLLPGENSMLRRALEQWFDSQGIQPLVRGEFADSAVLKVFGATGLGIFAVPSVVEEEVRHQYGVEIVARIPSIRERFYAITVERKIKHPAVIAITDAARQKLFA